MIPGQMTIDDFIIPEKNCADCYGWYYNRCTWGEMMILSYSKCVNKDKWKIRDDVKERLGIT